MNTDAISITVRLFQVDCPMKGDESAPKVFSYHKI